MMTNLFDFGSSSKLLNQMPLVQARSIYKHYSAIGDFDKVYFKFTQDYL